MMKRVLSAILILSVILCPMFSAYALTDDERYTGALDELRGFLGAYSSQQDNTTLSKLDDLWEKFSGLGNYLLGRRFLDYIDVLRYIEKKEYGRISLIITSLEKSSSFEVFLTTQNEEAIKEGKMSLGSLTELSAYASARRAQDENNITLALKYYEMCIDFLDSYDRHIKLSEGQMDADYQKAIQLMKQDELDSYIKARDLLKKLAEIEYLDSSRHLSTAEYKIERLSAPTPTPTPTPKSTPTQKPTPTPKPTPVIIDGVRYEQTANVMNNCYYDDFQSNSDCLSSFHQQSGIRRFQIVSVSFVNTLKDAPTNSYDISLTGDRTVCIWFEGAGKTLSHNGKDYNAYNAYIGANGTIYAAKSISGLFRGYIYCERIKFNGCFFNTSMASDMSYIFFECFSLYALDVSGFDTQNAVNTSYMFSRCSKLTTLDVRGFNTKNVKNMSSMFAGCSSLTRLDVREFDTRNTTNMSSIFSGCSSLTTLDISRFDIRNVFSTHAMFSNCSKLTALDVSKFDTKNVSNMQSMFSGCSSLAALDVSGFDTRNAKNMDYMFSGCKSLKRLDVRNFDVSSIQTGSNKVSKIDYMFSGCSGLERLIVNKKLEAKLYKSSLSGVKGKVRYQ